MGDLAHNVLDLQTHFTFGLFSKKPGSLNCAIHAQPRLSWQPYGPGRPWLNLTCVPVSVRTSDTSYPTHTQMSRPPAECRGPSSSPAKGMRVVSARGCKFAFQSTRYHVLLLVLFENDLSIVFPSPLTPFSRSRWCV